MTYSYTDDGRLQQIEETSQKARGFKTAASNGIAQYAYDANGNMTQDDHKEISVNYNYLNLPTEVEKADEGDILWSYDATGKKLTKQVTKDSLLVIGNPIPDDEYNADLITSTGTVIENSDVSFIAADSIVLKAGFSAKHDFLAKIGPNEGKIRHYCNGIEYFDGEMEAIYHEVGRVFFEADSLVYEWTLSDHLGNTRVVFRDDGTGIAQEIQQNDYYAFGLAFETQENSYNYTYNQKEIQDELDLNWMGYEARCLNVENARWISLDPMAELAVNWTPYRYGFNNPISYFDPFGLWEEDEDGNLTTNDPQEIERFVSMLQIEEATGGEASIAQIDKFISEERSGQGGRLSDGSVLLSTIEASSSNGNIQVEDKYVNQFWTEVNRYTSMQQNDHNWTNWWSPYPYSYYRERQWQATDGNFPGIALTGAVANYASHFLHNKYWWYSVKQQKVYSPKFHGNQYTGGRVKIAKAQSINVGRIGTILSVYGAYSTGLDIMKGNLTKAGGVYIGASDAAGIFGGIYGSAFSIGASSGRAITESNWYFNAVHINEIW